MELSDVVSGVITNPIFLMLVAANINEYANASGWLSVHEGANILYYEDKYKKSETLTEKAADYVVKPGRFLAYLKHSKMIRF